MPYDYIEDYEEVTGRKPEPAEVETITAKVVEAPGKPQPKHSAKAETKADK